MKITSVGQVHFREIKSVDLAFHLVKNAEKCNWSSFNKPGKKEERTSASCNPDSENLLTCKLTNNKV